MDILELLAHCNQEALFDICPQASSHELASKLTACNVGALLVTDEDRNLLGVVSERDLARAFAAHGVSVIDLTAEALMTRNVISCSVHDDAVETMARLNDLNIRHMPVLDGGRAIAMLSIRDFEYAFQTLQEQALTDALTGLSNKRAFEENLRSEFELHQRFEAPLSIAMFDVDHFKRCNDTYGHSVGDQLLSGLADVLRRDREADGHVARVGGEEFAILFPHTHVLDAAQEAECIIANVGNAEIPTSAGNIAITISGGVSMLRQPDFAGADVLRRADALLYEAKEAGRNCVKFEGGDNILAEDAAA